MDLRWLVLSDDDSRVSSFAYPYTTLLGGIRREVLRDRLSLPLHELESQSPSWGACITRASRGEELHLYNVHVIKDLVSLRPSSLVFPPFRGNGSQHRAIEVVPLAFDLDVGLIHPPAKPDWAFAAVERRFQLGAVLQDPAIDRRVVDGHPTFLHQLFDMAVAPRIGHVPPHTDQDNVLREMGPFEAHHDCSPSPRTQGDRGRAYLKQLANENLRQIPFGSDT